MIDLSLTLNVLAFDKAENVGTAGCRIKGCRVPMGCCCILRIKSSSNSLDAFEGHARLFLPKG